MYQGSCFLSPQSLLSRTCYTFQSPHASLLTFPPPHLHLLLVAWLFSLFSALAILTMLSLFPSSCCSLPLRLPWPCPLLAIFNLLFSPLLSGLFHMPLEVLSLIYNKNLLLYHIRVVMSAVSLLCSPCLHLIPKPSHTLLTHNGTEYIFPFPKEQKEGTKQN